MRNEKKLMSGNKCNEFNLIAVEVLESVCLNFFLKKNMLLLKKAATDIFKMF